jgi:nicotinamidase-related amidase
VPGTTGCDIHKSVLPANGETVIDKNFPSAFRATALNVLLQESGVDALVICGAMSHMCIDTTTRAAFDLGYQCTVVSDACSTRDLEFEGRVVSAADVQSAYMAALQSPFASVVKTGHYLEAG